METSFKKSHARTAALNVPNPATGQCQPTPPPETPGQGWVSLCGLTAPFAWVLVHRSFWLGPPRVCSPGLCKFWRLFGGVNGNLLQEGLCHTQVYFYLLEWIKIQKYDNALFARLCGQSNLSWVAGGRVQCPQRLNCQYLSKLDMQLFSGSGNTPYEST